MSGFARVSFLTDYGLADGFVAACHGVIARIAPSVPVLDVTHLVPAGDVRAGALLLAQTLPYLPLSVHVAVVDPGVGTARRAIALRAGGHVLVGPDNGLLPWAADALGGADEARELTNRELMLDQISSTFHGRDVFAPVAAHLAAGVPFDRVGPVVADPVRLPAPVAEVAPGAARAEVLGVDRFGNVQLSLTRDQAALLGREFVEVAGHRVRVGGTFGDVGANEPVLFVDSAGYLALAINGGDAAGAFKLAPGDVVELVR